MLFGIHCASIYYFCSASFAVAAWVSFVMMQQVGSANHTFLRSQASIGLAFLGCTTVFSKRLVTQYGE